MRNYNPGGGVARLRRVSSLQTVGGCRHVRVHIAAALFQANCGASVQRYQLHVAQTQADRACQRNGPCCIIII